MGKKMNEALEQLQHLNFDEPRTRQMILERAAAMLVCTAADTGEECYQVRVQGVTKGDRNLGDWLITIEREDNVQQ